MDTPPDTLSVICNGQPRAVAAGTTVVDFIRQLELEPEQTAVELDGRVLSRSEVDSTRLTDGSRLELIRFVGGG